MNADSLTEPGERSVDEVKQGYECDHVGGDEGYYRHGVWSTSRHGFDNISLRSIVQQFNK